MDFQSISLDFVGTQSNQPQENDTIHAKNLQSGLQHELNLSHLCCKGNYSLFPYVMAHEIF